MKTTKIGGFTLVELVIVIAILGVLAGIALPVYTGYIQKANEAADLQLLGAVNTAFAAACAERGEAPAQISAQAGSIHLDENGFVRVSGASPLGDAFMRYFGGNADTPFRLFTSIIYDAEAGHFVAIMPDGSVVGKDSDRIAFPIEINGSEITVYVKAQDLMSIANSAFAEEMTVTQLTSSVQKAFSSKTIRDAVSASEDYAAFLSELTHGDNDVYNELLEDPGRSANLLLFYAAQNTEETKLEDLRRFDSLLRLKSALDSSAEEVPDLTEADFGRMGLLYGLAAAYTYRYHSNELTATYGVKEFIRNRDNALQFYGWLMNTENSEEVQADLDGYISCMHVLSDNMQNGSFQTGELEYIASNGYTAGDIVQALDEILNTAGNVTP